jgi:hypothetical protein
VARDPRPPPERPLPSASADAKALARRTSWWLPGDLTLSRSSPPGKKNFRGAARLRQIDVGYNLLPQVRRGVTGRRHLRAVLPARSGGPLTHPQMRTHTTGSLRAHVAKRPARAAIPPDATIRIFFSGTGRPGSGYGRRSGPSEVRPSKPAWAICGAAVEAGRLYGFRFRRWRNAITAAAVPARRGRGVPLVCRSHCSVSRRGPAPRTP